MLILKSELRDLLTEVLLEHLDGPIYDAVGGDIVTDFLNKAVDRFDSIENDDEAPDEDEG